MEKITINQDVDYFITSDGRKFTIPSMADNHEKDLNNYRISQTLKTMKLEMSLLENLDGTWFLVANKEQGDYLIEKYSRKYNSHYVNDLADGKLSLGDWVAVDYQSDEDGYKEASGLYTLEYIIKKMKKFVTKVEAITVEGKY